MAYVVVSLKGQEIGRWPLEGPLSIGRSTECDVVVRDILLSRQHCRIEPYRGGWIAVDMNSKNGTRASDGNRITRRGLHDGEELTLGKTTIRFRMGRLPATHQPPRKRPADPFEALAGTVAGMDTSALFNPEAVEAYRQKNDLPQPKPMPKAPAAMERDDLYSLLTEIASSSWDSIYAQASQPKRPIPTFNGGVRPTSLQSSSEGGQQVAEASGSVAVVAGPLITRTRQSRLFSDDLQVAEASPKVVRPATPLLGLTLNDGAAAPSLATLPQLAAAPTADADPDESIAAPRRSFFAVLLSPLTAAWRWLF